MNSRTPGPIALSLLWLVVSLAPVRANAADQEFIWIEGEAAQSHDMRRHGWYDSVTKDSLSGGDWLSHFAGGPPPEAEYRFRAERSGEYSFWIRCNTVAKPRLSFRLNGGPWREVDLSHPIGQVNIASDGKPDMRFVAWVDAGKVRLKRGEQRIRIRFHSSNNNHGGLDCFVLTRGTFRPRGPLKPGERSGKAKPGFFAWEPPTDAFEDDALVDLRSLNEKVAGQSGRVRAEGEDFVLGSGKKVKFWAANAGPGIWGLDHASQVYLARRLAKCGVNMVRLHGAIYGARNPAVDERKLDDLHHLVQALKKEGIYCELSFFFPLWFHLDGDRRPFMLLFFDEEMQALYFRWAERLLGSPNPYTRKALGADPAVAIVELVNEDSHFFWTFGKKNMPEKRWRKLQALFGGWLRRKYGSLGAAFEAWGGAREAGDDPDSGRIDLYGAWEMTSEGIRAHRKQRRRIGDQVQFLTENMRGFYEKAIAHLRKKCRYGGLISCGNWHVSDASKLDALERYCYTAGDVIDHHGYFDHGHRGEAAAYSVRPGQEFSSQSALSLKQANPLIFVETEGYPHIVSEIGWPMPNAYRAEFPFLGSAYGSLLGLDGIFHFAIGSEGWDEHISKFPVNTPVGLGAFPAAALIYRRGDVKEAPAVVMDRLKLEDLYELKGSAAQVGASLDALRAADIPPGQTRKGAVEGIDPLAFYVGRVVRSFDGRPGDSFQKSLADFIDRDRKVIRSITGELSWDYGRGIATVNTRRARGAAGFLGRAGTIELGRVTIHMKNDYGTVTVVTLDDRPIESSRKILIQAMTIEELHGFRASGAGNLGGRIESVGSAPWGVQRIDATVTLELDGEQAATVTACDEHGYPTEKKVASSGSAGKLLITLEPTTVYHVVRR